MNERAYSRCENVSNSLNNRRDSSYYIITPSVLVIGKPKPKITGNDARLGLAVYVTYGVAKQARYKLEAMQVELDSIGDNRKERRRYIKSVERSLINEYTPVLKRMSIYQGRVLLKLIDRETGESSYKWVREMRGGFVAGFWQGVARIFGSNLKTTLEESHDDKMIELYVGLYNDGVLYEFLKKRTTALDPKKRNRRRK